MAEPIFIKRIRSDPHQILDLLKSPDGWAILRHIRIKATDITSPEIVVKTLAVTLDELIMIVNSLEQQ